jgi:hypothetical protein
MFCSVLDLTLSNSAASKVVRIQPRQHLRAGKEERRVATQDRATVAHSESKRSLRLKRSDGVLNLTHFDLF